MKKHKIGDKFYYIHHAKIGYDGTEESIREATVTGVITKATEVSYLITYNDDYVDEDWPAERENTFKEILGKGIYRTGERDVLYQNREDPEIYILLQRKRILEDRYSSLVKEMGKALDTLTIHNMATASEGHEARKKQLEEQLEERRRWVKTAGEELEAVNESLAKLKFKPSKYAKWIKELNLEQYYRIKKSS
jgi:hypothetical protein